MPFPRGLLDNPDQTLVVRRLRAAGPQSRAELAEITHLSRARLSAEIERLIALGVIESGGPSASRGGRPSTVLRFSSTLRFVGIDIGATSVDVALTDGNLRVIEQVSDRIDVRQGPGPVLDRALELVAKLTAQHEPVRLTGAGVGVPGPVSFRQGKPRVPPIMPGWDGFPIRDTLTQELSCPVLVDNDVNIMALGERTAGVAATVEDFLFIKIGTGIGCGIVVRGEVYRGAAGSAGDIGHIAVEDDGPVCACGNTACLEAFFGGAALERDALEAARSGRSPWLAERLASTGTLSAIDVGAGASAGDPTSLGMIRDGGRRLGHLLAALVNFFNPALIVLGGGVADIGHTLLAELRGVVYRRSLPLATGNLPIVVSELGASAGVIGAARLASDHVFTAA